MALAMAMAMAMAMALAMALAMAMAMALALAMAMALALALAMAIDMQIIKPMLCKVWDDHMPSPGDYPLFIQPKLDGIRCIVQWDRDCVDARSRNGKPLQLPEHTLDLLQRFYIPKEMEPIILDGELYAHGLSFQEVASRIKRVKNGTHPDVDKIGYHVYDLVDVTSQHQREADLNYIFNDYIYNKGMPGVTKVLTVECSDIGMINYYHNEFIRQGYEGSIIRDLSGSYEQDRRSPYLLKRKDWHDEEFALHDIQEGLGKNAGTAVLHLKATSGAIFTATAPGTYAEKALWWQNRADLLGQNLQVSVKFQELTDDGIPRFPIALGVKEDR